MVNRQMFTEKIKKYLQELPAGEIAADVNEKLKDNACLVVTAPPGAGKSTLLPLTIMQGTDGGKVLMLEPRRLAARQIAERMAQMTGEAVGRTVGYRVRFESKVTDGTRIEVLTEGILTRMLVDDPTLEGVSTVIFDEFHERSLASDTALALTREVQQLVRPDLRIVIMSATIDASAICQALGAPLVESRGRMFDVEIRHCEETDARGCAEAVASMIRRAHHEQRGDILAFLPGQAEITRCRELLGEALGETRVCPLYGMLSPQEQRNAIAPSKKGERKVVLATPVAETSLTIEGVRTVVDSGFCRTMVFDPRSGLSHLETVRITQDMAKQRSGRAGRMAEGVCYRLWTKATEMRMAETRKPEIMDADLAPVVLDIAAWGESNAERLAWLTPPPKAHVLQARQILQMLGATDGDGRITAHGKRLGKLPCHPRIAQILVKAETPEMKALAADIAALLEEKDPIAKETDADINTRIALLREARGRRQDGRWGRITRIAEQYRRMAAHRTAEDNTMPDPYDTGRLIASAFPERIAMAAGHGKYKMASGGMVTLDARDDLSACDMLAVAEVGTRIFLASPLEKTALGELAQVRDNVCWDSKQGRVTAQRERRIGSIVLDTQPISEDIREKVAGVICEAAKKDGVSMLDFNADVRWLQTRIAAVAQWHPELGLPDVSTEAVLAKAEEWLPLYIGKAMTVAELKKIDVSEALWGMLSYEQQQEVERIAPSHIQVPTGSRIRVDYRTGAEAPVLCVRLQECFGMADTPRIDNGRRALLMELLSPGFKPVQLTQDLRSFWENTYFEVRKELRRRYPKHSWPDNPLEAEAVRGTRRRGQ